ncbi:MAG: cytochrome c oxidase assembly protein [Gemmatimonadaceae bacterium]|nr:cytochrome c oxidase assembly protein [Gemmatimonadaceae bacterium]
MFALLLHPAARLSWTQFTVHPSTVIGISALGLLYAWRARRGPSLSDRHPVTVTAIHPAPPEAAEALAGPRAGQRASFYVSLLLLFLTLNGPLHDLSDYYLFSAHMVQHLIMTLIVPPLMILGTPGWMLRPLLRQPGLFRVARSITGVIACYAIFNVVLAFWHLPPMYNLALRYHPLHIVQHLMFLVAAVLMWWPLTSPLPELPRASYPAQMLYCFLMAIPMSVIAIYIVMADATLYPAYATAPRVWGISPMTDQQGGGLIMWIPSGIFFYSVMTVVFFKWVGRGEDNQASAQVGWVAPSDVSAT